MTQFKIIPLEERIVLDATAVAAVHTSTSNGTTTTTYANLPTTHSNLPYGVWPLAGHDQSNSGTGVDFLVNPANVNTLVKGWTLNTGSSFNAQPVVADGVVYAADFAGTVYAVKESSGQILWQTKLTVNDITGTRTENILTSPTITNDTLYIASDNLYAINRQTGAIMWQTPMYTNAEAATFQANGIPITDTQGGQVQLAGNYLIVGRYFGTEAYPNANMSFAGQDQKVLIFDATTGALVHSIDLSVGPDGTQYGPGGTFSMAGVDTKDHLAFIGTGNNYAGPASPYADSLIAIDYTTGQIAWHYQFKSGDIWNVGSGPGSYDTQHDLDVNTHANIFTVNGQTYVGQGAKDGTYRIFTAVQSDPNNVSPVATLSFGPGAVSGTLQATPVVHDGVVYIVANLAYNPLTGQVGSMDNVAPFGQLAPYFLGVSEIFALDLTKVINSGTQGAIPQGALLWTQTLSPQWTESPNGMTYDNGVLFVDGFQGNLTALDASNGHILTTLVPGPFETLTFNGQTFSLNAPALGGPSVDFGRVFVGTGVEGVLPGALVEYELPIMQTVDKILNGTPNRALVSADPHLFAQAMSLNNIIQTANNLVDKGLMDDFDQWLSFIG